MKTSRRFFRPTLEWLEVRLTPSSPETITINWDGQTRTAIAGEWFAHIDGLPGDTRQVQLQAAQTLLANAGVRPDIQAIDHAGTDGNIVLQTPTSMDADPSQLYAALKNVPGFQYDEPYFTDGGPQRTLYWADDNDVEHSDTAGFSGSIVAPAAGGSGTGAPSGPSAPGPSILNGFDGINFDQSGGWTPPDTDGAVGPNSFIENVNSSLAIYDKITGAAIAGPTSVNTFWAPEGESAFYSDPVAVYDEFAQKFVLVEGNFNNNHVFVAVSKTSNPTLASSDWDFYKYTINDGTGASMDYPKIGYNQDGYVITYNMFKGFYDHSTVLSIRKSDMAGFVNEVPGGFSHFTLAPASMHTSNPGDPMWFVEDGHTGGGGDTVNVVEMTNEFSNSPTFTTTTIAVTPYGNAPNPRQPGAIDLGSRTSLGTRFFFSGLRQVGNQTLLVSADAVGANGGSQVRWYEFDVAPSSGPTLVQQGAIDQGTGVDTFYPDIDIAPNGALGMTFDQSSATAPSGYLSMYVTGRNPGDAPGTMQTPVLAKQGIGTLTAGGRGGDYSFTSIDPTDGTFWTTNEYAPQPKGGGNWNWATYITHFRVAPPAGPSVIAQTSAVPGQAQSIRVTFDESIDISTFTPDKITSFTDPNGNPITVLGVTPVDGSNNTQFDISFVPQTTLGVYTIVLGPDIEDTASHEMDQDHDGIPGEPTDAYTGTFSVQGLQVVASTPSGSILPTNVDHVRLTFNEPVYPPSFTPSQLVSLTGPNGPIDLSDATIIPVAGTNLTQFDVYFDPQSATGVYDLLVGPGIQDLWGHQMDQDGNFIDGEVPSDEYDAQFTILGPKITAETGINPGQSYLPGALTTLTVTFNEPMDPTTFTPDQVVITGPNGSYSADSVTPVAGSNNTRFTITFNATVTGSYTLDIGPNIYDLFGNAMDQDGNLIPGEPSDVYELNFNVLGPKITSSQTRGDSLNNLYNDVRVTFNESMDPTTFTPDQITFTDPNGNPITILGITPVAGTNNTQFDISFDTQGRLGIYTMVIGPNIQDTFGNAMDQDGNLIPGEASDTYTHRFTVFGPKVNSTSITTPLGEPISSLRVTFNKPIDVTTFTPAKLSNFNGPNGPIGVTGVFVVPNTNNTQFDIDFDPQQTAGQYSLIIGPDIRDLFGNQMDQNGNFIDGEVPGDQYPATFSFAGPRITSTTLTGRLFDTQTTGRFVFDRPMDATTFTTDQFQITGPGGVAVPVTAVTAVPYTNNTQFDITFALTAGLGTYTLQVGPNLKDIYGNVMDTPFTGTFTVISTVTDPDGFGYRGSVTDFTGSSIVGLPGTFTVIAAADDLSVPIDLGSNTFNFYGVTYTGNNQLFASSNGLISFGQADSVFSNTNLTSSPAEPVIAALWTDWIKSSGDPTGPMVVARFDDFDESGTPHELIIEWNQVQHVGSSGRLSFQAVLDLNTGSSAGDIVLNFLNLASGDVWAEGNNATVGIKASGTQGANHLLINFTGTSPFAGTGQALLISTNITPEATLPQGGQAERGTPAMVAAQGSGGDTSNQGGENGTTLMPFDALWLMANTATGSGAATAGTIDRFQAIMLADRTIGNDVAFLPRAGQADGITVTKSAKPAGQTADSADTLPPLGNGL